MALTEAQHRALEIFSEHGPLMPKDFAKKMWPDSDGWHRHAKCGPHGVHRGGGMYIAAGGYIGKLCRKGWVEFTRNRRFDYYLNEYGITQEGRRVLRDDALRPAGR